jgi:dTDP-L-rhamnose 4-epimerase
MPAQVPMRKIGVLITGGAGFIGSHLADELLRNGYNVRILDCLLPQVHPDGRPGYLDPEAELIIGDVRNGDNVRRGLAGMDAVVHFAAAVGVGQSMYEVAHYTSVNVQGTAVLLEEIVRAKQRPSRIVVASSMSIYGEGLYACPACGPQAPGLRASKQLASRDWEMRCPVCHAPCTPLPTPESKALAPMSVYAVNKRDQEEMVLAVARSLRVPAVALRFFNVYGDRQALSNPYTGVAAIFSSCLLNGKRPPVFEDGHQVRDFIHVSDVARACRMTLEAQTVEDAVFNVGTGRPTSLLALLALLRKETHDIEPEVLGRFREGDVRACFADSSRIAQALGFRASVPLEEGVRALAAWVASQHSVDMTRDALAELARHRLVN